LWIFGHNFPATNARKPTRDSKDANFGLSKRKERNDPLEFLGFDVTIPKSLVSHPLTYSSPKKFKPKTAQFFLIKARRLSALLQGLNSYLSPFAGKLSGKV